MDTKIGMVAAVSEALRYRKQNPKAGNEEVIQHISNISMKERDRTKKMGMISAASRAVEYVERNPNASEKDVIRKVMDESSSILGKFNLKRD